MKLNNLLKKQLKLFLRSPILYISAVIFTAFIYINYFTKLQLSRGNGTSDLLLFFSSIPYISIIVIPSLCYKPNFMIYNDFLPFSRIKKITVNFLYIFICYAAMLVLLIPGIIITSLSSTVDGGQIFTSLICLIFYGASLISLCLFIGTVFNSQIITFVVSAVILGIINSSHLFPVYVQLPSFISKICQSISFSWHFDAASKGIIDTRDFIFLISITFLFLLFTVFVSEKKAGKQNRKKEKISISLSTILLILLMLNGNRWYKRFDLSKDKLYSISNYTKQLNSKIDKTLKITYYRSSSLVKLYPQIRDISDFLMIYSSQNKNVSLQIKDPDKENLTSLLENYGVYSQQLRSVKNNSTEFTNVYSAIAIEYNGNAEVIPFTMSANSLEYDLDGRILHLLTGEERFVNIIVGNGCSLDQDYGYVMPYLFSQGFVCNQFFITDPEFDKKLQNVHGTLLIIGDSNIPIENAISIESYLLQNKGNALITTNPFTTNIEDDWSIEFSPKTNIVEMVENWGVRFTNQIAGDISCARITMYSQEDSGTNTKVINYPLWISLMPQNNCRMGATLFWPVKLDCISENAKPYLVSSNKAYVNDIDKHNSVSLIETNPFVLNEKSVSKERETVVLGAEITGQIDGLYNNFSSSESHIIVISDQYFLNSLMNEYIGGEYGDYRNFDLLVNMLLKLNGEEELAQLQYR